MWLFPSERYLASDASSSKAWRTLFKALGVTDFIQAPRVTLLLTPEQKATSRWADADLGQPDASGRHQLQDCSATEFQAVVSSLQQHCKDKDALQMHCGRLAHHIDTLWEDEFARRCSVQLSECFVRVEIHMQKCAHVMCPHAHVFTVIMKHQHRPINCHLFL